MSDIYKINIPSFLIDPKFEIGNLVLYRVKDEKNRTSERNGRVVKILNNDEYGFDYLVEDKYEKDVDNINGGQKRYKVNKYDIFKDSKSLAYTFDICSMLDKNDMNIHRFNAECDLILKTSDKKLRQYYWKLRNIIASMIAVNLQLEPRLRIEFRYNFEYIGSLVSKTIMDYLYFDDHNNVNDNSNYSYNDISYKMKCFVGSSHEKYEKYTVDGFDVEYMCIKNQWTEKIDRTRLLVKHGIRWYAARYGVQLFCNTTLSCHLCRFEINLHDWICHCIPMQSIITDQKAHHFCLQCTYSMANGISQFENSLQNIVHQLIDAQFALDCIRLIVAFTVGNVTISRRVDNIVHAV